MRFKSVNYLRLVSCAGALVLFVLLYGHVELSEDSMEEQGEY